MKTKLYRKNEGKIISGVCGGLAEILNVDVTIVRIAFAFACIYWQFLILIYLLLALILPEKAELSVQPDQGSNQNEASETETTAAASEQSADPADHQQSFRQEPPRTESAKNPKAHSSNSVSILMAVILICSGMGLFITRVIFHYSIGFTDFITFVILGVGIYILVSGLMDNQSSDKATKTTKIVIGSVMCAVSLIWVFNIFGFMIFTISDLIASLRYLWPLLIVAIGLNILLPNKKASIIIWLSFLGIVVVYALLHEFSSFNFTGFLFRL